MEKTIALLISCHIFADFAFQTNNLSKQKHKPRFLLLHGFIHSVFAYFLLQKWNCWQAPLFVILIHTGIDFMKMRSGKDGTRVFIIDQSIHVLSLIGLGWFLSRVYGYSFTGFSYTPIIFIAGFIATMQASGILISKIARQLVSDNKLELGGLINGGKLIGQLERTLIFLFVFIGQPAGIGFLVAAKSILRFQESKEHQKMAEYVLIGTLLSFSLAIAMASITKWAIEL